MLSSRNPAWSARPSSLTRVPSGDAISRYVALNPGETDQVRHLIFRRSCPSGPTCPAWLVEVADVEVAVAAAMAVVAHHTAVAAAVSVEVAGATTAAAIDRVPLATVRTR